MYERFKLRRESVDSEQIHGIQEGASPVSLAMLLSFWDCFPVLQQHLSAAVVRPNHEVEGDPTFVRPPEPESLEISTAPRVKILTWRHFWLTIKLDNPANGAWLTCGNIKYQYEIGVTLSKCVLKIACSAS
jgi:hypothetical protein